MSSLKIYIDGKFHDQADAKISVFDHGLLYGDGIFEGIRAYNGRVFLLKEHIDRLYDSAKAILLQIPVPHDEMMKIVLETCKLNSIRDGYIRLVVTRGVGDLGMSPDKCGKPSVFCIAASITLYPEEYYLKGLKVVTVPTQRMGNAMLSPAVKSLNYLNNIMAKIEGNLAGAQESILLNAEGYVAECSGDNLFIIKRGHIFTPPIFAGALGGITRRCTMDLVKTMGKQVVETSLTRYDLFVADEIFLTGSAAEIVPVTTIDGRVIGDGKPGPITGDITRRFKDLTRTTGVPIY